MFDFPFVCASDNSQALILLSFGTSLNVVVCQVFEKDRLVKKKLLIIAKLCGIGLGIYQ